MTETLFWIQHTKKNRSRKNGDKDRKALYKLMSNSVYRKAMENLRNRIDVKLVCKKKKKDCLKWTFKASYMSHKANNYLVGTRKNKVTLTFKKHAYIGMCIFELSKVLMY